MIIRFDHFSLSFLQCLCTYLFTSVSLPLCNFSLSFMSSMLFVFVTFSVALFSLCSLIVTIPSVSVLYSLVLYSIRFGHYSLVFVLYSLVTTCGILLSKSCITWNSFYQCSMAVCLSIDCQLTFLYPL